MICFQVVQSKLSSQVSLAVGKATLSGNDEKNDSSFDMFNSPVYIRTCLFATLLPHQHPMRCDDAFRNILLQPKLFHFSASFNRPLFLMQNRLEFLTPKFLKKTKRFHLHVINLLLKTNFAIKSSLNDICYFLRHFRY